MTWKQNNFGNSEYKKRLESFRDKLIQFRDEYVKAELEKLKHLQATMEKVNEHKAKTNGLDT